NSENLFQRPLGIVVDENADRNRELIVDAGDMIIAMDLTDGSRQVLSDYATPTSDQPELDTPTNIALDPDNPDIAYIVDEGVSNVQILNLITGARTILSDNDNVGTGPAFRYPASILLDSANKRALVGDGAATTAALFSVDLATGDRTIISDLTTPQESLPLYGALSIVSDNVTEYVYFDSGLDGILKVDVAS